MGDKTPEITDVKEVSQLIDMFEVNRMLKEGWILLNTFTTEHEVVYVLGKI